GSEHKGCIATESAAAALGGVTSYMDMPNNTPAAVTIAALEAKEAIAKRDSTVNYSFYLGAAANRLDQIRALDASKVCGVKVFIGSSTGSLLVEDKSVLDVIFATSPVLIAVHAEDNAVISANMAQARSRYGDDIPFSAHPDIRSREACIKATKLALSLAEKHGSKLHIMHVSTLEEAELIREAADRGVKVTGEVCVSYLMFNRDDYARYGAQIKCNPAIKERTDMLYLREAVKSGLLPVIGTDHAPHLLSEKNVGSYAKSPSGIPMVQHSLLAMLELVNQGVLTLESVIERMCHAPADLFNIKGRGYLRKGYFADLVAFDRSTPSQPEIASRCGWAPLNSFSSTILHTMVNGEF
ncbi:MAG: amidohydrolase family protein, partial [Bacteroidales bacterium]|nr:amidohydrolase family protein [Bacteroidales bacterium]